MNVFKRERSLADGGNTFAGGWFKYFFRLRVGSFHLVVHGPRDENATLFALKDSYPVIIEDECEGAFHADEKKGRLDSLLGRMPGEWLLLVDSDEFVELPYRRISPTVRMLKLARTNVLCAPMTQRLANDGLLDTPDIIEDPFS